MPKAICINKTKRYNTGDIVEIPRSDHPFIVSGDFEMIKENVSTTVYSVGEINFGVANQEKIVEDVVTPKKPFYRKRRR